MTERGGEEGERITCDSLPFLSTPQTCIAKGRGEEEKKKGNRINS